MRLALLCALVSGCGTAVQNPTFCRTECDLFVAATNRVPQFPCEDYQRITSLALADPHMPTLACLRLRGVIAWEVPGLSSVVGGVKAAGWAECWNNRFMFHTGDGRIFPDDVTRYRRAWDTAFIHEMIHIAQGCESPAPTDEGADPAHSNWVRDKLYDMPSRVRLQLGETP